MALAHIKVLLFFFFFQKILWIALLSWSSFIHFNFRVYKDFSWNGSTRYHPILPLLLFSLFLLIHNNRVSTYITTAIREAAWFQSLFLLLLEFWFLYGDDAASSSFPSCISVVPFLSQAKNSQPSRRIKEQGWKTKKGLWQKRRKLFLLFLFFCLLDFFLYFSTP